MLRFFISIVLASLCAGAFAQSCYNKEYPTYWNQRATLFQALPIDNDDIVFEGNSISDGCEWAELFNNPNCKNRGISGDTSKGILDRIDTDLKGQPAKIFLMIGTNDLSRGVTVDTLEINFVKILDRIAQLSPQTKVYVQTVLPVNDHYGMFQGHTSKGNLIPVINEKYKNICQERGITFVDLFSEFANEEGKMNIGYSNDGLHLNGAGYLLWKNIIEDYVNE